MYRYFRATCNEDGTEPDENTIIEIASPAVTGGVVFAIGILVGVIITILFR
jgi:hypothetical protein|tara:strand:- start:522 stop:674 length:153 start_codon:yes stop_codon:yes gene_type:complete